jgi:hypothetical protein
LLALTPEAVASLSNLGLVKRAQREIAEGQGPALEETSDGTVIGKFSDGTIAKLLAGKTLKDAQCTCNAQTVCRHRVAVALAYKPWHAANLDGAPPPSSARVPTNWSPAEITDEALEKALGQKRVERARASMRAGVLVTVERDGVPTAKLPACTVRFLVPRDPAYARCDCRDAQQGCEHVVIAVWAFREAQSHEGSSIVVSLGGSAKKDDAKPLDAALEIATTLLHSGVTHAPPHLPSRFAAVRADLDKHGFVWPLTVIEDLERALEQYEGRSALYDSHHVAELLCELESRSRASHVQAELPVRFVLGQDEATVTPLDHVRLISLGARVQADGRVRFAQVYLADPDTAMVLLLRKRWDYKEGEEPEEGPALARRAVASKVTLGALAAGQVVSKVVRRKANRELELGTSRTAMTSVTPQRGDWENLPTPILIKNLEEHEAWLKTRPPRALRPRLLAENVHVIAVSSVEDVVYFPADQQLLAKVLDAAAHPFFVRVTHRRVAPNAIDAATAAFAKKVRFVAGELTRGPYGFEMDPLAIAEDVMTVPDVSAPVANVPTAAHAAHRKGEDPVAAAVEAAESALAELAHFGLDAAPAALTTRCQTSAENLDDAGIESLGSRMRALGVALKDHSPETARAWLDAAVRASLVREAL